MVVRKQCLESGDSREANLLVPGLLKGPLLILRVRGVERGSTFV